MDGTEAQKRRAVEQHSAQAEHFAQRYRDLEEDAYQSCFTYSRKRLDVWLDRFLPLDGSGRRLLDAGCGTGDHLARYRNRGYDVCGLDGSVEMVRLAKRNNPGVEIQTSDVEHFPYPDRSFDFVICIEVLRYLPTLDGCIREIRRVLRPGGICLVTAAPRLSLNGYWLVNGMVQLVPVGNLVRLKQYFTTSGGLRRIFSRAGLEQVAVHGVYMGPVNWGERLAPGLLPRLLRAWEPWDATLADLPFMRDISNMYLVRGIRST